MTEDGIIAALEDALGKGLDSFNDADFAIAAAATSKFARSGNSSAKDLTGRFTDIMRSKGNKYMYSQYPEKTPDYISLKTIGDCTSYRYFYDDSRRTATMTQGAKAYVFNTGNNMVIRGNATEELKYNTVMQKNPYISGEDAEALFNCKDEYLNGTSFAVCLTGTMDARVEEILSALRGE